MAETSSLRFLVLKEPVNEFIQKQENKNTLSVLREDLKAVENDNLPPEFWLQKNVDNFQRAWVDYLSVKLCTGG